MNMEQIKRKSNKKEKKSEASIRNFPPDVVYLKRNAQISDYDLQPSVDSEEFIQYILGGTGTSPHTGGLKDGNPESTETDMQRQDNRKASADFLTSYLKNRHHVIHGSNHTLNKSGNRSTVTETTLGDSDWEKWWIHSPLWRRFNVLWLVVLLCIALAQLCSTVVLIYAAFFTEEIPDPYICQTENCKYLSRWLNDSIDDSVSPCDNFYSFVCGKYNDETDDGIIPDDGRWDMNQARLEFGGQNVLASLLKNVNNEKLHDQHVTFFKKCLDPRERRKFGFEGIRNMAKYLFVDIRELDNNPSLTLEQMAVDITTALGDFGLVDFEMHGYPYILLHLKPYNSWKKNLKDSTIKDLLNKLFPELSSSNDLDEIAVGVNGIKNNYNNLFEKATNENTKKKEDMCDANRDDAPFDLKKVFEMYTETNSGVIKMKFLNDIAEFTYYGLNHCWDKSLIPSNRVKSSFGAFWMIRILMYSHRELSLEAFGELKPFLNHLRIYTEEEFVRTKSYEFQCFKSLQRNLGYLPTHRYFEQIGKDYDLFFRKFESTFKNRIIQLIDHWNRTTNIDSFFRQEGMRILLGLDPYVLSTNAPSFHDRIYSKLEDLGLTNDHFVNAFKGKQYTLRQSKRWWQRLRDKGHILHWNSLTFDLEKAHDSITPINTVNSIFTPMSFYLDPYDSNMLAIKKAGTNVVVTRAMLKAVQDYIAPATVKKRYNLDDITFESFVKHDASTIPCMYFDLVENPSDGTFKAVMKKTDFKAFFLKETELFLNVLTLKTAHADNLDRSAMSARPFWVLTEEYKQWIMAKELIGFEVYTEEQLFFMTAVRHHCRQKQKNTKYAAYVINILSTLMQMSEFAEAWKCPEKTPMNPPYKCFAG